MKKEFTNASEYASKIDKMGMNDEALKFALMSPVKQELYAISKKRAAITGDYLYAEKKLAAMTEERDRLNAQEKMGIKFLPSVSKLIRDTWATIYHEVFKPARQKFFDNVLEVFKREEKWETALAFAISLKRKANSGCLLLTKEESNIYLSDNDESLGILPNAAFDSLHLYDELDDIENN